MVYLQTGPVYVKELESASAVTELSVPPDRANPDFPRKRTVRSLFRDPQGESSRAGKFYRSTLEPRIVSALAFIITPPHHL